MKKTKINECIDLASCTTCNFNPDKGSYLFVENNLLGVANSGGLVVYPAELKDFRIIPEDYRDKDVYAWTCSEHGCGILNENGEITIPLVYDEVYYEGCWGLKMLIVGKDVGKNTLYGLYSLVEGKEVLACIYYEIGEITQEEREAAMKEHRPARARAIVAEEYIEEGCPNEVYIDEFGNTFAIEQ